ncbi:ABC transporter substrate-binding protein [Mariniluteicoccus flavus]
MLASLVAGSLVLTACGGGGDQPASETKEIKVTMANHVWTTEIQKAIPEFEKATGIKVNVTTLGESQLSDQYNVKLNAGTNEIDVMMYRPLQEGRQFAKNKWVADLTKYTGEADYNWADFQEPAKASTTIDGKVTGVPLITEREVLYYNKDILAKAGVQPPKTLDELEAAAKTVKEKVPDTFGIAMRGQKAAAVTQFSSFLFSEGGDFAKDGRSTLDSEAAKKAYARYGGLLKNYGPPGASNMNWPDAFAIYQQGKAAFLIDADSLYKNAIDPQKSKAATTTGYAAFPAGSAGSKPYNITSWALGINNDSKAKDASWKFIKWATDKQMTLKMQQAGTPGARASVWSDPQGTTSFPKELADVIQEQAKNGVGHDRPEVVQVGKARDIVGGPIIAAIGGQDVNGALSTAHKDFQTFLDGEKK